MVTPPLPPEATDQDNKNNCGGSKGKGEDNEKGKSVEVEHTTIGNEGNKNSGSSSAKIENNSAKTIKRSAARAPTELDKTFLATSSNIEDGSFDVELEQIQSELQRQATKVMSSGSNSFLSHFSSGYRIPSTSTVKVSPRRPFHSRPFNQLHVSDFDVVSEGSDISSSRLNVPSAPVFSLETAAYSLDSMSLSDLEILERMIATKKKKKEKATAQHTEVKRKKNKKKNAKKRAGNNSERYSDADEELYKSYGPLSPAAVAARARSEEDGRDRSRSDSIGPEVRRARALARMDYHEFVPDAVEIDGVYYSSKVLDILDGNGTADENDPSRILGTTPPAIPTTDDHQEEGGSESPSPQLRPGAPNLQMFASELRKNVLADVAEFTRKVDMEEYRLPSRKSDIVDYGLPSSGSLVSNAKSGRAINVANMMSHDMFDGSTQSVTDTTTTDLDTYSDDGYVCSMCSDTNSNVSNECNASSDDETLNNCYSKSPKQLSFASTRKKGVSAVPALQIASLTPKSHESERKVTAPDPRKVKATINDGENAFSPRSIGEDDAVH